MKLKQSILAFLTCDICKVLIVFSVFLSNYAFAQSSESPVGQGLGYIMNSFIYGADGTVLATIAIAGSGVAAYFHKIHWGVFIGVAAGVSIVFGSPAIVSGIKSLVSAG